MMHQVLSIDPDMISGQLAMTSNGPADMLLRWADIVPTRVDFMRNKLVRIEISRYISDETKYQNTYQESTYYPQV